MAIEIGFTVREIVCDGWYILIETNSRAIGHGFHLHINLSQQPREMDLNIAVEGNAIVDAHFNSERVGHSYFIPGDTLYSTVKCD